MSNYQIEYKRKEIQRLKEQTANYQSEIAKKRTDIIRCNDAIRRTKSETTIKSKQRDIERFEKQIADLEKKIAENLKKEAQYNRQLNDYITRLDKERDRKLNETLKSIETKKILDQNAMITKVGALGEEVGPVEYDVFISHASEDKGEIADQLAQKLKEKGVNVWYDKFSLSWGDSLKRKIEEGIANSKFGIVVLSHNFFNKEWPQQELDALFNKELLGDKVILPIWHNISKNEVAKYSPLIAGKLALKTSDFTIDEISGKLVEMLKE